MFEKVVEVSSLPPLPETEDDIKAVIKPSIKPFIISLNMGAHPEFTFISVDLDYMIDLFDLNGVLLPETAFNCDIVKRCNTNCNAESGDTIHHGRLSQECAC
jgi:hypothetical protein